MSETKQRSPAMLLQMAASLVGFSVTDGWPKSLTPSQLAALQFPNEGTLREKKAAIPYRNTFLALVKSAIDAGTIETVAIEAMASDRHSISAKSAANEIASSEWLARDFRAVPAVAAKISHSTVRGITPKVCAAWFQAITDTPQSGYVRAWLGDEWQGEAQDAIKTTPAATPLPTETTKERRIAAIVATACSLKYEPKKIEYGGKAAIKDECLKDAKLFTDSTFDKAWQAAIKAGKIKVENSETYAKR